MLSFDNVGVTLDKKEIIRDISFSLRPHTLTALLGRNASGKSTLLSCLNGREYVGSITYDSKDIRLMALKEKSRILSVLPQILPSADIAVEELVRMGRNPYLDLTGKLTKTDKDFILGAMAMTGIEELAEKPLTQISGGERQKAYIAMVLAQNTRVIALDEPATYMDMPYEKELMLLLRKIVTERKKTVLAVMHNINAAMEYAHYIAVMDGGRLVFYGSAEECKDKEIIEKTFGVRRVVYTQDGEEKIFFR